MYFARTPSLLKKTLKQASWEMPDTEKKVYLTFDDGPTPMVTTTVLNILDTYNAKGTFFCIGKNVVDHPEIYEDILKRGHSIGNHTYNHLSGWETTAKKYVQNTEECAKVVNSNLFRPPYGRISPRQYNLLKDHYHIIMWSVLSWDFDPWLSWEHCMQNVVKNVRPGSIVVFHDSEKAADRCIPALKDCLKRLGNEGYEFAALPYKAIN
ncbi:MAG: polysaccharide deacetylase family protein [Saprospiraceae bacterium]|nr:polysaccharide deacetylase family protein [Saprospiraceae bacterium]